MFASDFMPILAGERECIFNVRVKLEKLFRFYDI